MSNRAVTVSLMRNEADIVEAFIRYHQQFVSGMLFIDHRSEDNSREIVNALKAEGLPVELKTTDVLAFDQAEMINAHTRLAIELFDADWVIPLDLDECISTTATFKPLDELERLTDEFPLRMPWRTYVPTASDNLDERNPFKRITNRLEQEPEQYYKVAVPSKLLKGNRHYISTGNHALVAHRKRDALQPLTAEHTHVAHFPVRSPEQYARKVLLGWLSMLAKGDRHRKDAYHWKHNFDQVLKRGGLGYKELEAICTNYLSADNKDHPLVVDPIPAEHLGFPLTLPGSTLCSPFVTALRFAEEIAHAYGEARTAQRLKPKRRFGLR